MGTRLMNLLQKVYFATSPPNLLYNISLPICANRSGSEPNQLLKRVQDPVRSSNINMQHHFFIAIWNN